jgi:prepilin-type N-terminal cleavage/methylation domain-containing protein
VRHVNRFVKPLRRRDGFSRLEFLIVLVILLIVIAVAAPSVLGSSGSAKDTSAGAHVATAVMSAAAFYADNETYAGLNADAVRAKYVRASRRRSRSSP